MNFIEKKNEFFARLGESCYMVLATTHNDYPLASMMTCLVFDEAIWMQTDKKFPNYEHNNFSRRGNINCYEASVHFATFL